MESHAFRKIKNELVKSYLAKYPSHSQRLIARVLYEENPAFFIHYDAARSSVRYWCGSRGKEKRKNLKDKTYVRNKQVQPSSESPEDL